jgi:hypothetical protein
MEKQFSSRSCTSPLCRVVLPFINLPTCTNIIFKGIVFPKKGGLRVAPFELSRLRRQCFFDQSQKTGFSVSGKKGPSVFMCPATKKLVPRRSFVAQLCTDTPPASSVSVMIADESQPRFNKIFFFSSYTPCHYICTCRRSDVISKNRKSTAVERLATEVFG